MFLQTELVLSERERRRRDVKDLKQSPEKPKIFFFKPSFHGMGIDLPEATKWLMKTRLARWVKRGRRTTR